MTVKGARLGFAALVAIFAASARGMTSGTGTYGSSLGSRGFQGLALPKDVPKALEPGLAPLLPPRGAAMGLRP